MKRRSLKAVVVLFCFALCGPAQAAEAVAAARPDGLVLARQVFDRERGQTTRSQSTMVLVNKQNKKRTRLFSSLRISQGGLESTLIRFTSPADIDGTGFLTIEKQGYETDQFLFLPALSRRTRRIVSSQKHQRFVNSDFTYEDMERHPVEDYTYKITGEKQYQGLACWVLETRPKPGTQSQYTLTESLIAKQSLVPVFIRFFDKKNGLIKTYAVLKLDRIDNIWTESIVLMENKIKQHKTYLKINQIEYNRPIPADQVSKAALEQY